MKTIAKIASFPVFVVSLYLYEDFEFCQNFVSWWKKL